MLKNLVDFLGISIENIEESFLISENLNLSSVVFLKIQISKLHFLEKLFVTSTKLLKQDVF